MRTIALTALLILCACASQLPPDVPHYSYQIVHAYPHDNEAFTEGLFYLNGDLYESTGLVGQSSLRRVKLETGELLQKYDMPDSYFGEGIVNWKNQIVQLTWQTQVGFVYDLKTFEKKSEFHYSGEGWALTQDGRRVIMDDGTPQIRFWNPESLQEIGRITVTDRGQPVTNLNELESVEGEIYANVWGTSRIARINPDTGKVLGWIDLSGLESSSGARGDSDSVLNGIAYDAKTHRLFVTGKRWPKLFEIRLVRVG
ncbi:MAG: glutaminyl-peptide cyclotransferase [Bryobacteraceae bacterium]